MDLEYRDLVDAIKEALRPDEPEYEVPHLGALMPVKPFKACDFNETEVWDVVGMVVNKDDGAIDWVVIKTDEGGGMMASFEGVVWPVPAAPVDEPVA